MVPPLFVISMNRRFLVRATALGLIVGAGLVVALVSRVRHEVRDAVAEPVRDVRPVEYRELILPGPALTAWGGAELSDVTSDGAWLAGGFGLVRTDRRSETSDALPAVREAAPPLPALAIEALTSWRERPVVGLRAGGIFVLEASGWREIASGWGTLEVRALAETAGGELLVGARQGLFRLPFGARQMERLSRQPVRAFAAGDGFVLAGGEEGLERIDPGRVTRVETPDPWIESATLLANAARSGVEAWVVTATGLVRGPVDGPLVAVPGGERVVSGTAFRGRFVGVEDVAAELGGTSARGAVRWFEVDGQSRSDRLEARPRRLIATHEALLASTDDGAWWTDGRSEWKPVPFRWPAALPARSAHITALAASPENVLAGVFDGGLIERARTGDAGPDAAWRSIPSAHAWGVNALLVTGGATYVASLRGAARLVAGELTALEGPGAAFSFAETTDGTAIGYAQGVRLATGKLLSAFHGLPGNQALALVSDGPTLFVGTPSGLGAIRDGKVRWRMTTGDERLPNPWVTALVIHEHTLFVGTYGGGIARRTLGDWVAATSGSTLPPLEPFAETASWKVNPGAMAVWNGRCYAGTDGQGLFRLARDLSRFERVAVTLPSARVTALTATPEALYIGTDQGIAVLVAEVE